MKILLALLCITNLYAKDVYTKKIAKIKSLKATRVMCNQKSIPMKVEQTISSNLLTVNFTAEKKIEKFSLQNVRGLDGVTVSKFQELLNQKLERGESIESSVEIDNINGLVYVIFDVAITVNGINTMHSIPVAVGSLSEEQKKMRSKNIKEVKSNLSQKESGNALSAPPKKIHEMKLE